MLKLIVKCRGKILKESPPLEKGQSYTIGRSTKNFIVLPEEAGISRKHLEVCVSEEAGTLQVKNLSSLSALVINGEEREEGEVAESFQVQGFEFVIKKEQTPELKPPASPEQDLDSKNDEAPFLSEAPPKKDVASPPQAAGEVLAPVSSTEKTTVMEDSQMGGQWAVYLKVYTEEGQDSPDIFKLKPHQTSWTVGKDKNCDLVLEDSHISRKHFQIQKEGASYFIMDLKSSNGTVLNDKELKPKKNYLLESGDSIFVLDMEIFFEVKNLALEKEIARLKPEQMPALRSKPSSLNVPAAYHPSYPVVAAPAVLPEGVAGATLEQVEASSSSPVQKLLKNKRFVIYGGVALIIVVVAFLNSGSPPEEQAAKPAAPKGELSGLSMEQQQMVKDSYQAAKQLYSQGKYEYCRSEIQKIHSHTDSYKGSKRLEVECTQAAENQRRQLDLEQKNKKAAQADALIQKVTDKCQSRFNRFKSKAALMTCLTPALELSPADSRVQILFEQFDEKEAEKLKAQQLRAKRRKKIQAIIKQYEKAKQIHQSGHTIKAIDSYKKFLKTSSYKELESTKQKAKRELSNITKNFEKKTSRLKAECESQFQAKKFKQAWQTCKEASLVIPAPYNKEIVFVMNQSRNRLQNMMKPIYEDATIHESVGNIATAKTQWQKIIAQDIEAGVYYDKAKIKLSKY